jgi:hypothetical protein
MNRRPNEPGKPVLRVRLDGRDKLPSQNRLAVTLTRASRDAESVPAREPSQAMLDSAARRQGAESREAQRAMRERRGTEGFKDSTRMRYMQGGDVEAYAKGGSVKGAAKVSKVMGEFKRGELHSGSKKGPKVTNPKQAMAIAMSEAGKSPTKKAMGGPVGMMPHRKGDVIQPGTAPKHPPIMRDISVQPKGKTDTPIMPSLDTKRAAPLQAERRALVANARANNLAVRGRRP